MNPREWGISVDGAAPTSEDTFTDEQAAREAVWVDGGERLMVRDVTEWQEAR